jgi:uncharacterized SAM-binding protein YcdF (DUF218 family)
VKFLRYVWLRFCAVITLLYLLVTFTPFVTWYGGRLAGPWNDSDGDTLIVLAGGALDGYFPSENTLLRCLYALRAYQAGHFRGVVVTGFQTSSEMRRILGCTGIPPAIIQVEGSATSTRENALATARLLATTPGSKVLLTSDYHMFRASRAFRKAGLVVVPYPIPDARKRATRLVKRWPAFLDEGVETVKIVYYYLRGWI